MTIGLVGAGNMARALAKGWGEPLLCSDGGSGRAGELVQLVGGEALRSNGELAEKADVVVLAHKPSKLSTVADEIAGKAKVVVSLLARVSTADLHHEYPKTPIIRVQPNLAVEVRRGVTIMVEPGDDFDPVLARTVRELFQRVGTVVAIPETTFDAAAACSAVGPAYWALMVEAQVDAAVRWGIPADQAAILVGETMGGSAELLRNRNYETLSLRREVTSPGGTTSLGIAALERGGVRSAFATAIADVLTK